jgi:hypothetical protein
VIKKPICYLLLFLKKLKTKTKAGTPLKSVVMSLENEINNITFVPMFGCY